MNPGDEVIVIEPYFDVYSNAAKIFGVKIVGVHTHRHTRIHTHTHTDTHIHTYTHTYTDTRTYTQVPMRRTEVSSTSSAGWVRKCFHKNI
jgi:hypothetical protein